MSSAVDESSEYGQQRQWYERNLQLGLCGRCGKPRAEDGTKTMCRVCAAKGGASILAAREQRRTAGLCEKCGKPRGEDGSTYRCRPCTDKQSASTRAWRERRSAAGLCVRCGGPRAEDGTKTMCRVCTREQNDDILELRARKREQGLCEKCGEPRGEDGTAYFCRPCANKQSASTRAWVKRLFTEGRCPVHQDSMSLLESCPACLYEAGALISSFSFAGLLPPSSSGDMLERCVGCAKCGSIYHKGGSYSFPRFPPDFKLRNECVGEGGGRVWLRPDTAGKLVEIEFEACSMPDDKCTVVCTRRAALDCLRSILTGRRKTAVCPKHVHDRARLTAAAVARARGNGQKDAVPEKRSPGHQLGDLILDRAQLESDFKEIVKKLRRNMPQYKIKRRVIAQEYERRGEPIHESTVTKRVQLIYGDGVSVEEGVTRALGTDTV